MKISRSRLRRIIREERDRVLREQSGYVHDPLAPMEEDNADKVLRQAIEIFGDDVYVDEAGGEVIIDVGDDAAVEARYDEWMAVWPEGLHAEDGIISTGMRM